VRTCQRDIGRRGFGAVRLRCGHHRTLRVDLDKIDEKLRQPVGAYWNDLSAKPRKRTNNKPVPDRSTGPVAQAAGERSGRSLATEF
jgi:hypothetical protein